MAEETERVAEAAMRQRVIAVIREIYEPNPHPEIKNMFELAPGVVAVEYGEIWEVFYDTTRWASLKSNMWEAQLQACKKHEVNLLRRKADSLAQPIRNTEDALDLSKRNLRPLSPWHLAPVLIPTRLPRQG